MEALLRDLAQATDELGEFVRSMPVSYARSFSSEQMQAHRAIVSTRGQRAAHAGLWKSPEGKQAAPCVVADSRMRP